MHEPRQTLLMILFSLLVLLAGCASPPDATQLPATLPPVDASTSAPLELPTEEPALPALLLWSPADAAGVNEAEAILSATADSNGMDYSRVDQISVESLPENTRLVVALPPAAGLQELAANFTDVQFIALQVGGLSPAANLTLIGGSGGIQPAWQGFMAGYFSAVIAPDWRMGVLSVASPEGQQNRVGFLNGAVYFCGLCQQLYPPFYEYPVYVELAPGSDSAAWQAAANELLSLQSEVIYIMPGAGDTAIWEALAGSNAIFIGGEAPPAALSDRWAATIGGDWESALRDVLPLVLQAGGQGQVSLSMQITHVNQSLLSEARVREGLQIYEQIKAGIIDPLGN